MDLFGTAGIRGSATERVTPELATAVGRAVGRHVVDAGDADADAAVDGTTHAAEVVVGRDGRTTGPALAAVATALVFGATPAEVQTVGGLLGFLGMVNYFLRPVYHMAYSFVESAVQKVA
mgnify:CR=1 FL=1